MLGLQPLMVLHEDVLASIHMGGDGHGLGEALRVGLRWCRLVARLGRLNACHGHAQPNHV
jgi:hypothetical protein